VSGVELLPCPHCAASSAGGVVRLLTHEGSPYDGSRSIVCDYSIGGCGASGGIRDHAGQAAVVWNRRDDSALSRRVAELEGALAWQPIETAPKDKRVLILRKGTIIDIAEYGRFGMTTGWYLGSDEGGAHFAMRVTH
jgi:hypothetical protein